MDTLKNILKPGGNKDDEVMYSSDPNRGKVSGEGSHFPQHGHTDSGVEFNSTPVEHIKPTSGVIGASATKTAEPGAQEQREFPLSGGAAAGGAAAGSTAQQSSSEWPLKDTSKRETNILEQQKDVNDTRADGSEAKRASQIPGDLEGPVHNSKILNELDPRVKEHPGSATTGGHHTVPKVGETHHDHTARDATVGAGAGAAAGEAEHHHSHHSRHHQAVSKADQQHDVNSLRADGSAPKRASQIPGDLEGPVHNSKILNNLDPRVKEHPGSATTGGHHSIPKVGETHHGDAAAAAGAGAGAGAAGGAAVREGEKFYDAPQTSEATTTSGPGVPYRTLDPAADHLYANRSAATEPPNTTAGAPTFVSQDGKDAAQHQHAGVAAAAAGAAGGAGLGAAAAHHQPATTTEPTTLRSADAVTSQPATAQPTTAQTASAQTTSVQPQEHHAGRDAAVAGGAAGAGALGAHEFSKKEAEKQQKEAEKEAKEHEKELEQARKSHEKEVEKQQKQQEKEVKETQKQHEKEEKEAEKQHEKDVKAAEKQHAKEEKEAEKQHEKELKQQEKEQKEAEKKAEKEHAAVLKDQQKYQKEAEKKAEKQHAAEAKEQEKAEKAAQKEHEKELKEAEKQRKKEEKDEKPGFIARLLGRDKDSSDKHTHEAEGAAAGVAAGAGAEAAHHHHETTGTDGLPVTGAASTTTQPSVAASGAPTTTAQPEQSTTTAGHFGTVPPSSEPTDATPTGGHFGTAAASEPSSTTAGSAANTSTVTGTAAATGAAAGIAAHDHEAHSGPASDIPARKSSVRNKLHKDPPAGYAEAPSKGYASQVTGGTGTTALAQGNSAIPPPASESVVPGTRYGSGRDEHVYHDNDPAMGVTAVPTSTAGGTVSSTVPYAPAPQTGYASQVTGGTGTTQLAQGHLEPIANPRKDDPLNTGPKGYAAQVTGGTGTTQLAHGGLGDVQGLVGERTAEQAVTTQTPYEDAPEKGYATQVTGGTGTTQLARGTQDPVSDPSGQKDLEDKVKEALVLK